MGNYYMMFGDNKSLYTELPVDIDTFIEDDHYIGKETRNGQSIYPFWRQRLREMFDPEHPNKYREMFCATAIGTGKTRATLIAFTYTLYCYMCLRNPNEFFKFNSKDTLAFVIASVGKTQFGIPQNTFLDFVKNSPWFMSHGNFTYKNGGTKDILDSYIPLTNIEIIYASKNDDILGVQVVCAYTGHECDRYNGADTYEFYGHVNARVESRTIIDNICYGRMFTDFELTNDETNIKIVKMQQSIGDVLSVNGSQFMVKPQGTFDYKDSFFIAYDGIYGHSKIITKDDFSCCQELVDGGWKFICCPISTLEYAKLEPDRFLLHMCGIQLSVPKNKMNFTKALEELMDDKAIMEDGKDEFYALDENGLITSYSVKTNKIIGQTKFELVFNNYNDLKLLLNSNNWISFQNPVNNNDSET